MRVGGTCAGTEQGEAQDEQGEQHRLALEAVQPGSTERRAEGRCQGRGASQIPNAVGGHVQFADEIRAERHDHHQAADR